jgi:hypothetical protein
MKHFRFGLIIQHWAMNSPLETMIPMYQFESIFCLIYPSSHHQWSLQESILMNLRTMYPQIKVSVQFKISPLSINLNVLVPSILQNSSPITFQKELSLNEAIDQMPPTHQETAQVPDFGTLWFGLLELLNLNFELRNVKHQKFEND